MSQVQVAVQVCDGHCTHFSASWMTSSRTAIFSIWQRKCRDGEVYWLSHTQLAAAQQRSTARHPPATPPIGHGPALLAYQEPQIPILQDDWCSTPMNPSPYEWTGEWIAEWKEYKYEMFFFFPWIMTSWSEWKVERPVGNSVFNMLRLW